MYIMYDYVIKKSIFLFYIISIGFNFNCDKCSEHFKQKQHLDSDKVSNYSYELGK